jgi:membrane glycosyltransferase
MPLPRNDAINAAVNTPIAAGTATAPLVRRSPMRAPPWFGLLRGLLFALWPGVRFPAPVCETAPWQRAAQSRRGTLLAVVGMLALLALGLQGLAAPDEPTPIWFVQTVLGPLLFACVGVGFATALMGAWVMLRGDRHALALHEAHAPIDRSARTAVIMPICNEDVSTVFSGLRAACAPPANRCPPPVRCRWGQGNLQNARLIAEPGLRPVHRTMLAVWARCRI